MFQPLLAICRLSARELKVLLYIYTVRARVGEISTSRLYRIICDFYIECGGVFWLEARYGLVASIEFEVSCCAGIVKRRVPFPSS